MAQINNRRIQTAIKITCILASCVVSFIGIKYFHTDVKTVLIFGLFVVFYMVLPGLFLVERFNLESKYYSSTLSRAFFAGFALNIAFYYITHITNLRFLLYIVGPLMSAMWIYQHCRQDSDHFKEIRDAVVAAPTSLYIFAFLVFTSSMFVTQFCYISPAYCAFSDIKLDFGYHAGIANALAAGFPPQDQWIDNYPIYYHYFSEMLTAIPMSLFKLTSENLLLECTPYLIAPAITLTTFAFFREFSSKGERAGLYCLALHFSNMFILRESNNSWFLYHIYSNINNAGLGITCMMTALPLLKEWDEPAASGRKFTVSAKMIFLSALVMLMSGIKGPVAIVFVGGVVGTFILALLLRSSSLNQLAVTVLSCISFILIYVFVVGTKHDNMSTGSIINLGEVSDIFLLKEGLMNYCTAIGVPRIISLLILLILLCIFMLSAFVIPFVIGYVREFALTVSKRKDFSFSRVCVYASWMVGFLALMVLDFDGHSQVYFGFASCMITPMIAFWFLEDMEDNKSGAAKVLRAAFAVCMVAFSITSLLYTYDASVRSYVNYASRNDEIKKYRCVSTQEYEGLIWLRDNTDKDALIASDRYASVPMKEYKYSTRSHNYHFAYAIYSQRRQYLEGSGFSMEKESDLALRFSMIKKNDRLYDANNDDRGKDARDMGVNYVVVSKRFNKVGSLENKDYELCFSNDHMDIYKVKAM